MNRYASIDDLVQLITEPNRAAVQRILADNRALFSVFQGSTHNHQAWPGGIGRSMMLSMNKTKLLALAGAAAALIAAAGLGSPSWAEGAAGVPVPRITIYPGDVILSEMLVDRKMAPGSDKAGAVFETRERVLGKVARRTLLAGQPIPMNALREQYAVTQGSPVLIVFESSGLIITARGTALQSGSAGEAIPVRNISSGATVVGTARADGSVRVGER